MTVTAGGGGGASGADVRWVVTDQLGTPRMVLDKTGSLDGVTRHDYFPFGEDITGSTGGRTSAQGYNDNDSVRQKFTGQERDAETKLDYMKARYFSSAQGRFTSPDPMPIKQRHLLDPRDLNRYAYVANNPLKYIDPTGLEKIMIIVRTFIPYPKITYPPGVGQTFNGNVNKKGERLPGREGYKTEHRITIETDPNRPNANHIQPQNDVGITRLDRTWPLKNVEAHGDGKTLHTGASRQDNGVLVDVKGNESNPLAPGSPGITYNFNILVQSEGAGGKATIDVTGTHDGFPAYEIEVVRPESGNTVTIIPIHDPRKTNEGAGSLFPNEEHEVKKRVEIPPKKP